MKKRIVFFTLVAALLLTACGGSMDMAAEADQAPAATPAPETLASEDSVLHRAQTEAPTAMEFEDTASSDMNFSPEPTDYFALPITTPDDADGRRLVYSVSMRLQSPEFLTGMRLLLNTTEEMGGELEFMEMHGNDIRTNRRTESRVEMRLQIPTEELAAFIFLVENNYNILHLRQERQDETARHQSTDWTLDDLRDEERWLVEQLEDAEGDEYQALSATLRDVRSSIRELEAAQTVMTRDVVFSTVTILFSEAFLPQNTTEISPVVFVVLGLAALVFVIVLIATAARRAKKRRLTQLEQQSAAQAAANMSKVVTPQAEPNDS